MTTNKYLIMAPFIQLDIPVELPSELDLYTFCISSAFSTNYNHDNGIVIPVACKMPAEDWRSSTNLYAGLICDPGKEKEAKEFEDEWFIRANSQSGLGNLYYNPGFKKRFPALVDAINALPFKFITAAFIMLAGIHESVPHKDPVAMQLDDSNDCPVLEFERFNIQLNCFNQPRFFLTDETSKFYIKVTSTYPCFAFNNRNYLHGADAAESVSENRMQILVYGIIDEHKYFDLIHRSIEKFQR